jgi:hypothetical protein
MRQNATLSEILNEIENVVKSGKASVNGIDSDEDGRLVGTDDVLGEFDNISGLLDDLRGRLHGIADAVGNVESELSDA